MSGRSVRWVLCLVAAAFLSIGLAGAGLATASAASTGDVYIVHGIVGSTVAISVDGSVVQASVIPKSVIGPLHLAAGQHVINLKSGSTSVVTARFSVGAGDDLDVVAHRSSDQAMTPVVTVFRNDLSPVAPGKTRLVVSHVAVAPPADIRVDGKPLFRNVANAESLSLVVPAKTYSVDVIPTATGGTPILGPVRITLKAGCLTRVFAIGSVADNSTDAIVQNLPVPIVGAGAPTSVHTGDGGQAADSIVGSDRTLWTVVALSLGLAAIAGVGAVRGSARSGALAGSRHAK
jgi:molybdopterin-binding protein